MNWFLKALDARGKSLRRARLLVRFGFWFGLYCLMFAPILFYVSAPEASVWTGLCSCTMMASPFVLRWRGSVAQSSSLLVAAIAGLFAGTTATLGGLYSPTTPCLAIAPIVALFLRGARAGVIWSIVVIVMVVVLYGLEVTDNALPLLVDPSALAFLDLAGFVTVVGVTLIFLLSYDRAQQRVFFRMSRFNRRMIEMISHLEATSAALRDSAASFHGDPASLSRMTRLEPPSGQDTARRGRPGLTRQMMFATSSGRDMINSVDESIRGMIEQYKVISRRITELHEQSAIIEDMVRTIDSISNRLDLMALNAGIEAEHAGVHGRNFKFLADDMRLLAERVLRETSRIKSALRSVQGNTSSTIEASRTGQLLTDQSASKLDLMSTTFDEIYELVERTASASQQLTSDTARQLTTIYDLVNASLQADEDV